MNIFKCPTWSLTGFVSQPWLCVGSLLILASALRFYQLDSQLWLDEISALRGYRKPFLVTLTTFPVFFPNPLYELMAHACLVLFGESALSVRLPAAVFGVAGVLIFYRLARRCLGSGEALLAGALLAVSYHHVFYSQDARGYTTYLFFALLATDRLIALLETMRWRTAFAYAAVSAMAAYAHPFGLFVLLGQMIVAVPTALSRRRAGDRTAPAPVQIIGTAALGGLAVLILYAPLIQDSIAYAFTEARTETHGPRGLALLPELVEGLRAGFGGWPVLILGIVLGVKGTLDLLRRHPVAFSLLAAPLIISTLTMAALGAGIHPRYFLLALPLAYLVGTRGLMQAVRWLLEGALRLSMATSFRAQIVFGVLVAILACFPLLNYYAMPKQDYVGALRGIRELAHPEDRVVAASAAPRTVSGRLVWEYYDSNLQVVDGMEDLLQVEAAGRRVWVVTTLERVMSGRAPKLLTHLHRQYRLIRVLPGSVGDGAMRIYVREAASS